MIGIYVEVPVACFRKGYAREFLETEPIPPPSTCYGFLLSLIGETERLKYVGCRIAPVMLSTPEISVVLRTVHKFKNHTASDSKNAKPDYQQLLTNVKLVIWLDSHPTLEEKIADAIRRPESVTRFSPLSLGESSHLVNDVCIHNKKTLAPGVAFLLSAAGKKTMPVWVDHVGSADTKYVTGNLIPVPPDFTPNTQDMPLIKHL